MEAPPELLAERATDLGDGVWQLHGSAVAVAERAVVILGAAGRGKSSLALQLMAHGGALISDDMVLVEAQGETLVAARPPTGVALVEARGIGLLRGGHTVAKAALDLVVDLDRPEPERLPPRRHVALGAARVPLILGAGHPCLAYGLLQMLRHGRATP